MAGRPKKPIDLMLYEGRTNLTKEEIKKRQDEEIKAPSNKVEPPKYLPKKLKDRFNELASDLLKINIMSNLDNDNLGRYLFAEDKHQEVSKALKKVDMLIETDKYDKLTKIQDRYAKQARAAANDLGLTVSSRVKLVVPQAPEKPPATEGERRFANRL